MNLDQLQVEVEGVLALLRDREPGLISWNKCLKERLESICRMIEADGSQTDEEETEQ